MNELVVVKVVGSEPEAELLCSLLRSADIERPAPFSRMHSANFTALSRSVAFLVPPVPVLLPVPVSEGAPEPQPALFTLIRATIARTASGRSVLLMVAPLPKRAHHCCILGSCVGSAYIGGQP
jgi:hypothetical protein